MQVKLLAKKLLPPLIYNIIKKMMNKAEGICLKGPYLTWSDASDLSTGYNDNNILKKVASSTLKVINGEAAYERDSVLFKQPNVSWNIIGPILFFQYLNGRVPRVLDFGGALGSLFYQHQNIFSLIKWNSIEWNIVEQPGFVEIGTKNTDFGRVYFYNSIFEISNYENLNVAILSSVLEYLESPWNVLDEILTLAEMRILIIDRTPFFENHKESIYIQETDRDIYMAKMPCRVFNYSEVMMFMKSRGWHLVSQSHAIGSSNIENINYKNLVFIRH